MTQKNVPIDDMTTTITFTNRDGEQIGYFRMNTADIQVAARATEVAEWLKTAKQQYDGMDVFTSMTQANKDLAEKANYLLGYNAAETLFCKMSPLTFLDDGSYFFATVMETIAKSLAQGITEKLSKFMAVSKYSAKYE